MGTPDDAPSEGGLGTVEEQLRAMSPEELSALVLDVAAILRDIRAFEERRRMARAGWKAPSGHDWGVSLSAASARTRASTAS